MHKVLRTLFRDHWAKLTDADLDRVDGQVARLTALLGEKYGYPRRRAERELLQFPRRLDAEGGAGCPADRPI